MCVCERVLCNFEVDPMLLQDAPQTLHSPRGETQTDLRTQPFIRCCWLWSLLCRCGILSSPSKWNDAEEGNINKKWKGIWEKSKWFHWKEKCQQKFSEEPQSNMVSCNMFLSLVPALWHCGAVPVPGWDQCPELFHSKSCQRWVQQVAWGPVVSGWLLGLVRLTEEGRKVKKPGGWCHVLEAWGRQ